jgi:glycolate oxidase
LRLGSLGSGAGWINGDGPGPSLRGALRGYGGPNGGNGIFTKIATKVYPWYGPPDINVVGEGPDYALEVPKNYKIVALAFKQAEDCAEFLHQFYEESLGFSLQVFPIKLALAGGGVSNDEALALYKNIPKEMIDALGVYGILLSYDGSSDREMAYKNKVFQKIVENNNAIALPEDSTLTGNRYNSTITAQGTVRGAFRASGTFMISPVSEETWDSMFKMSKISWEELMKPLEDEGKLVNVAQESQWGVPFGDGCGHLEMLSRWDPTDSEANKAVAEMVQKGNEKVAEWKLGINSLENALSYEEGALKGAAPYLDVDFIKYMKRIKKALDPKNTSESAWYVSPDEDYKVGKN